LRSRRSRAHRELVHVKKALEWLNKEKVATVDLVARRQQVLHDIAKDIADLGLTESDAPALEVIIDGHAAGWRQTVERRRHSGLATLDHLKAEVQALVAALTEYADEKRDELTVIQGVKANLYDQVGDPEQPNLDPVR
jgi:hypothetical protein